jgi:flagellar biosynthesis chaperone FliJ
MPAHDAAAESLKSALSTFIDTTLDEYNELRSTVDELSAVATQVVSLQQLVAQHASQLASARKLIDEHRDTIFELRKSVK